MRLSAFSFILFVLLYTSAFAQHEGMEGMESMPGETMEMRMNGAILPTVPMQRGGSGTGWLPDTSPVHAFNAQYGTWDIMVHGNVFPRYTNQDINKSGKRGASKLSVPNWLMIMGNRPVMSAGQITLRGMFSLDRLTEGGDGYPLLFQTGETWNNERLIDRQHPHDLFGELAIAYGHSLGKDLGLFLYLGYPGEPALGPSVYLHRSSAESNPDAPLGHHWQDATHIVFGVATLGLTYKQFKLDSSVFTGREPDENRFNFDKPRFDSYSARLSVNPSDHIALQVSGAFIKSPETLEPETDIRRTTASVMYTFPISDKDYCSTTLLWGMNKPIEGEAQHSSLVESSIQLGIISPYVRIELIQKPAEELGLESFGHQLFLVSAFTLGAVKDIISAGGLSLGLGTQGTIYGVEKELEPYYGKRPFSLQVFLRLRPAMLRMDNHHI